jgi:serine/threonine protein kinase
MDANMISTDSQYWASTTLQCRSDDSWISRVGESHQANEIPERVGRFRILGEIARGGMSVVLQGRDDAGNEVAIKLLTNRIHPDSLGGRRFLNETSVAKVLDDAGVIPVLETGNLQDIRPYFVMPIVRGDTFSTFLSDPFGPCHDPLNIFESISTIMANAHRKGIVHRDLKPSNIMLEETGRVLVMDWGLAKILNHGEESPWSSEESWVLGTPAYMSPEQANGHSESIDSRCDVFGLGAILCEILTGDSPYTGTDLAEIQHQAAKCDLTSATRRLKSCGADPALIDLTLRCLQPTPTLRPQDAGEVLELLKKARGVEMSR